jgi:DNA mismatch repair protein MutL
MYQQRSSHRIHILPEHIIDQIKAGEVIERPSTLLKELLENSIDAEASKIDIEIINNGMDLLVVRDNGKGMPKEDMELAFLRHATSKIENFEDIYHLSSYGFRGEALASMASISKITCVSNEKNCPESTIKINGSIVESQHTEDAIKEDSKTEIYIKDLFFNTPARMKFVKSQTAEKNQLKKIINAFLLSHPEITFSIRFDEKPKKLFKKTSHLERIKEVTEKSFEKLNYLEIKNSYDNIHLHLFLGLESSRGNQGKTQYILVNHRMIQNMQIHKIITHTSAPLWGEGSGNYVLFLDIPSDQLDVNVHPNKTVIKFFETFKIHSLISSSIKSELKTRNEVHEVASQGEFVTKESVSYENKDLNYNTTQIESESELDQYFLNLDDSLIKDQDTSWKLIKEFSKVSLLLFQNDLLVLNHHIAILTNLKKLFNNSLKLNSIPLLISQPIRVEKTNKKLLDELNQKGFEIDLIDKKTYVLRSYPEPFKYYNLDRLLEMLLTSKANSLDECLNKITPQKDIINSNFIMNLVRNEPLTDLISSHSLQYLTEEKLLHES